MKNKKNTYILLLVVLFIWGLLIYRFFSFTDPEAPVENGPDHYIKPISLKPRDTIRIDVNYRDPFLGKMYEPATAKATPVKKKSAKVVIPETPWPSIIYKGIVSDTKDKKKVFMLLINGKTFLMHEKETEADVALIKGNNSQITVKYKGMQNLILLQP